MSDVVFTVLGKHVNVSASIHAKCNTFNFIVRHSIAKGLPLVYQKQSNGCFPHKSTQITNKTVRMELAESNIGPICKFEIND